MELESDLALVRKSDRYSVMLRFFVHTALLTIINCLAAPQNQLKAQPPDVVKSSVQGDLKFHQLISRIFGNERTIRVLLPPGYDDSANIKTRYPVLYLNDGQNLFDVATSLFNPLEWQVDESVHQLISQQKILPLIVVGIDNAGKLTRPKEYLPFPDKYLSPPEPSPEGKKYPDFLVQEIIPFINSKYRTRNDPDGIAIGGSSYGAVAALYTVIAKPGVFGRLLLESPSLYISDGQLLKDSQQVKSWPAKIYIGVGTNEEGRRDCQPDDLSSEAVQDVLKLRRLLQSAGLTQARLQVTIDECARHNEADWAKRLPAALTFLFGH